MSGYSKTPLFKKLGYKEGMRVHSVNPPQDYEAWIAPLPEVTKCDNPPYDLVHIFTNSTEELETLLLRFRHEIAQNGMIWVSWYKKASRMPTEITEDTIRNTALAIGLVDVKVCAVNDQWSGLKVVIRKELRIK